ncbi:hypothetical protein Gogos_010372, partial [Gossypium gossypioides]|nr:hypothetical protein [Gossypium gossypioides]
SLLPIQIQVQIELFGLVQPQAPQFAVLIGIGYISSCPICSHGFEDIVHVLRDCLTAKEVWLHVIPSDWAQQFEFHQSGYKINKHNPIHNFQDNSLWVQLYIDGAVVRYTRNAFAGGMLRDQCRKWILGFNRYLGKCLPFEAE